MFPHGMQTSQTVQAPREDDDKPRAWRRERFVGLGFTEFQAEVLANTLDGRGFFVWWADVKALFLDKGCDHATAFDILSEAQ